MDNNDDHYASCVCTKCESIKKSHILYKIFNIYKNLNEQMTKIQKQRNMNITVKNVVHIRHCETKKPCPYFIDLEPTESD